MLEVLARSQRGRICRYSEGETSLITPAVIPVGRSPGPYISIEAEGRVLRFMGNEIPLDGEMMFTASSGKGDMRVSGSVCVLRLPYMGQKIPDECGVVAVSNAFELRKNPRKLIEAVTEIREAAGFGRLLYFSGIAEPSMLALLSYMGVDLFDETLPLSAGMMGIRMFPEGEAETGEDSSKGNCAALEDECVKTSAFIAAGRLRELADQRSVSSPGSVALLRLFDDLGYAYQEEAFPLTGSAFSCNTVQSLRRPDNERYRRRISERYEKPEHKRILLLLPCSAVKPYHTSRSHRAFSSAVHTGDHDVLVHEVILTSPLGLVPRELDVFYPANSYDVPVTGEWNCYEKEMIRSMLKELLLQKYDRVVCHFPDYGMISDLAEMEFTVVNGDPVSGESLERLDAALRNAAEGMDNPGYMTDRRETVRSVLKFQFGKSIASAIMDGNTYVTGKYPYWKIIRENPSDRSEKTQLGMLTPERGMISLTLEGAEILADAGVSTVDMTDFELKGNLFAVGVEDADPDIRIGDEAVIMRNGKVAGVGVAEMCGREMVQSDRGMAVRVRHKSK
jgi:archaeosine synthase